jgi:hypothetical protein
MEFCRRLVRGGERIACARGAIVYHPVAPERGQRQYIKASCFGYGRTIARREEYPFHTIHYFALPRYLFRSLGERLVRWLLNFGPRRLFYWKLQSYAIAGEIYGKNHLWEEGKKARFGGANGGRYNDNSWGMIHSIATFKVRGDYGVGEEFFSLVRSISSRVGTLRAMPSPAEGIGAYGQTQSVSCDADVESRRLDR